MSLFPKKVECSFNISWHIKVLLFFTKASACMCGFECTSCVWKARKAWHVLQLSIHYNVDIGSVVVRFIHNIIINLFIYIFHGSHSSLQSHCLPTSHNVTQSALNNQPISTAVSKAEYTMKQLKMWKHTRIHVEYSGTAHFGCLHVLCINSQWLRRCY